MSPSTAAEAPGLPPASAESDQVKRPNGNDAAAAALPSSSNTIGAPPLQHLIDLHDVEAAAEKLLSPRAWAFFRSAADEERTYRHNAGSWQAVRFRPRVMRGVGQYMGDTKILGIPCRSPVMIAPAASAGMAHPEGELGLVRAAGAQGLVYCVSNVTSISVEEIAATALPGQPLFYQIYVRIDRQRSVDTLRRVRQLGFKAIVVTADVAVPGKRTLDDRQALSASAATTTVPVGGDSVMASPAPLSLKQKFALAGRAGVDSDLKWDDLKWIREVSGLPLVVKGITSCEDAEHCASLGVEAIWLSNHGGRQLDDTPTSLETLLEIRKHCPELLQKCEVYLDGGVRRGADVVKALCLGAKAVGVGRPFMYSLAYGEAGARHVAQVLDEEIGTAVRLLGCNSLGELQPGLVNTKRLDPFLSDRSAPA